MTQKYSANVQATHKMVLLAARKAMYDPECCGKGLVRMVARPCGGGRRSSGGHMGLVLHPNTFFSVARQNVPLEAKDKLRWVDEGYVRIF
jgi:hypothetical protein